MSYTTSLYPRRVPAGPVGATGSTGSKGTQGTQGLKGATDTQKTFYNASTRINTGDRIHLYVSYTGSNNNLAEDVTGQIDLF